MSAADDPFAGDRSARVTVTVGGTLQFGDQAGGTEYLVKEYSFEENILNVGDPFSCTIANVDGEISGQIKALDPVVVSMSDPTVSSGAVTRLYTGRVIIIEYASDIQGGSVVLLTCADLGWLLKSCHARPHTRLTGITIRELMVAAIDPSWGFAGVRLDNVKNRKLKQGRQGIDLRIASETTAGVKQPPIQTSPGEPWIGHLVTYARRIKRLINVSADGYLQVFAPNYKTAPAYKITYRKSTDTDRNLINIQGRPTLRLSGEGIYSESQCWSTKVRPPPVDTADPNAAYFHESFKAPAGTLSFDRLHAFMDMDQIDHPMAAARAQWAWQRGLFDAWTYEVTLAGNSQNGALFAADSMAEISDTVHKVSGMYYVFNVRQSRTIQGGGTTTTLRLARPGLLSA